MGACPSNKNDYSDGTDKTLTKTLKSESKKDKQIKKLLFLGSGGSGKSTLFKQLRTIHGDGYSEQDKLAFIPHIHSQIIEQMQLAIQCIESLADESGSEDDESQSNNDEKIQNPFDELSDNAQNAVGIIQSDKDHVLTLRMADACKTLWDQALIKSIYDQRAIMTIEDSSAYFWDKIDVIMDKQYVPDETDILMVRYRTTGVIEQTFTIKNNRFWVFDVGGQKSERKKWIHCFENVTAIIFVASLSCYDEVMFEDEDTNSMVDTLLLFEKICNNIYFDRTSMILFLNKKDLFLEKITDNKAITICERFKNYNGNQISFEETTDYIKAQFECLNRKPKKKTVYTHLTCATDQNNVQKVFNDVQHIIIEASLLSAGLMGDIGDTTDDNDNERAQLISKGMVGGGFNTNNNIIETQEEDETENKNISNRGGGITS